MTDAQYLHWHDDPAGWSAGTDGVKYLIRPHKSLYRGFETSRDAADHRIGPDSATLAEAKALCETHYLTKHLVR